MTGGERFKGDLSDVELALACDRLKQVPSVILAEDGYTVRRVLFLLGELDRIKAMRNGHK